LVQILGGSSTKNAAGKCTKGPYKGETCLLSKSNKYPVTSNGGKLDPGKIRAALTYGSQYGVLSQLKANGICGYASKAGIKSKLCGNAD
jgi:hypothetical protein